MRANNYARYTDSHKFGRPIAVTHALEAIAEGEALRRKLEGKRILPSLPIIAREREGHANP